MPMKITETSYMDVRDGIGGSYGYEIVSTNREGIDALEEQKGSSLEQQLLYEIGVRSNRASMWDLMKACNTYMDIEGRRRVAFSDEVVSTLDLLERKGLVELQEE